MRCGQPVWNRRVGEAPRETGEDNNEEHKAYFQADVSIAPKQKYFVEQQAPSSPAASAKRPPPPPPCSVVPSPGFETLFETLLRGEQTLWDTSSLSPPLYAIAIFSNLYADSSAAGFLSEQNYRIETALRL